MVGAVEGKRGRFAIDKRGQMHGPAPDRLDVRQGVGRLIEAEFDPRMHVLEQQFPAVAVIAVYYIDPRFSEISQAKQEPLLDFLKIAGLNKVLSGLLLVGE